MKVLIVGSKGFIGSNCKEYFAKKHEIWGCDIALEYNESRYFVIDVNNADFSSIFSQQRFDLCINCSGAANVPFSLEKPSIDFDMNVMNVVRILEAIRQYNPECKFITMSSAAVYGNPVRLPVRIEYEAAPVSPYGYHKVMAERICEEYNRFWGIRTCCLRVFSAYGPGLRKQLFWDMYQKFRDNDTIELFGTGDETRDFIYISDLVRAVECVIDHAGFNSTIVNVANGVQTTIRNVAETFVSIMNSDKVIRFNNIKRKGDPDFWQADISDLKKWGYKQIVDLRTGVENYLEWVEKELQ